MYCKNHLWEKSNEVSRVSPEFPSRYLGQMNSGPGDTTPIYGFAVYANLNLNIVHRSTKGYWALFRTAMFSKTPGILTWNARYIICRRWRSASTRREAGSVDMPSRARRISGTP